MMSRVDKIGMVARRGATMVLHDVDKIGIHFLIHVEFNFYMDFFFRGVRGLVKTGHRK
jgi:hypothetical protein